MVLVKETPTRLLLSGESAEIIRLSHCMRFKSPSCFMATSYQIWRKHQARIKKAWQDGDANLAQQLEEQKVGWDGYRYVVKFAKGVGQTERGHLARLIEVAREAGIELDLSGLLKSPYPAIVLEDIPDDLLAVPLDPDQWAIQKRCIFAWLRSGMGRNQVTVSGGKTAMFCAAAAFIKRRFPKMRFLYFTPTERLVRQVTSEARRFLPSWSISQFGGGSADDTGTDMVVCTIAILNKRFRQLLASGWIRSFGGLLMDEAQYAASPSMSRVILASSAYFRFSASDTIKEDDIEKSTALTGLCGPVMERVETIEMIRIDRVATPTIEVIRCPAWRGRFKNLSHEPLLDTKAWVLADGQWHSGIYRGPVYQLDKDGLVAKDKSGQDIKLPGLHRIQIGEQEHHIESRWCLLERKYDRAISSFQERNRVIADKVKEYSGQNWQTLVVATRTLHVMLLHAHISKVVAPEMVRVLYGHSSPTERDETFAWFKATPGAVLISPLVKVGVSINEIRAGVIADCVSDWELARQLIGRFIRKKPDGTPNDAVLTMFEEEQHPDYRSTSRALLKKLRQIEGYRWRDVVLEA